MTIKKNILILATNSDFSQNLSPFFFKNNWNLYGTSRSSVNASNFIKVFTCDFSDENSVTNAIKKIRETKIVFDLILNCVGILDPIGYFKNSNCEDWKKNIVINSLNPIYLIKEILSLQLNKNKTNVIFFSGSGTNDPAINYSAYTSSKILLIKLTEILDAEYKNVIFTILGPGVVDTKIHQQTFRASAKAGENLDKLKEYYNNHDKFTSYNKIYDFIDWVIRNKKNIVGGRNFSILNDNINSTSLINHL
ncbi:SDR family NAD(P)-dependent oxidoreductase, partial [Candidatus Woesearchaeota archaeon]|nr:SDR family NAD(P)-dependent oxidoreductase [Candidatus Woesearchaeota archaeon]